MPMHTLCAKVPIGNDALTVWFYPAIFLHLCPKLEEAGQKQQYERIVAVLVESIASWDLTEKGQTLPVTYATLDMLPFCCLVDIIKAFAEVM